MDAHLLFEGILVDDGQFLLKLDVFPESQLLALTFFLHRCHRHLFTLYIHVYSVGLLSLI